MKNIFDTELMEFIVRHPSCYQVAEGVAELLKEAGFEKLDERECWKLESGGKYYTMRNDSAIIAWAIPKKEWSGFSVTAAHSDSPCLKLKENPELDGSGYVRLNCEMYGGAILSTWFDRPLMIAGRICVAEENKIKSIPVVLEGVKAMIPSLAIHMNRQVNDGYKVNVQKDMPALFSLEGGKSVKACAAEAAGVSEEEILSMDLFAVNAQPYTYFGADDEFMASPRLDDVACVYASLRAMLEAEPEGRCAVMAVLDNEEVGSSTRQGAASTFLKDVISRISEYFHKAEEERISDIQNSFMLSADNGHALHPNYPEKCDPVSHPILGGGVLLKYSANQKYTTDAVTAAQVRLMAREAGVELQTFANRADIPGGSTLGNISSNQVAIPTADIGLPQLAMHSAYECCGCGDCEDMYRLMKVLFGR